MANEIRADYDSGDMLYAVIRNQAGQVWNVASGAFEDWGSDGHTAADYDIALADRSGSLYVGHFDPAIPAGTYSIQVFIQSGAAPADADSLLARREVVWSGVAELTPTRMLANKAIHDTINGVISYYDDDAATVILTHTIHDDVSTVTRDPN